MSMFTGTSESGRVTYGVNEPAWQVYFVEPGILQKFRLCFSRHSALLRLSADAVKKHWVCLMGENARKPDAVSLKLGKAFPSGSLCILHLCYATEHC